MHHVPTTCTTLCSNRVAAYFARPIAVESPHGRLHSRWDDELRYPYCSMVVQPRHCTQKKPLPLLTDLPLNRQDANIAGQATGAMSWAFIAALKKNPQQSYVQLLNSIRDELEAKYTQKPQLSCSHPLGTAIG